jgi:hypothetical protein
MSNFPIFGENGYEGDLVQAEESPSGASESFAAYPTPLIDAAERALREENSNLKIQLHTPHLWAPLCAMRKAEQVAESWNQRVRALREQHSSAYNAALRGGASAVPGAYEQRMRIAKKIESQLNEAKEEQSAAFEELETARRNYSAAAHGSVTE